MGFSIIAAVDSKRGIGIQGKLPWRLKGDMDHFREITIGDGNNVVIMGRSTWESLPEKFRPLPQRLNVVLSHSQLNLPAGILWADSLGQALQFQQVTSADEVFIIGGGRVYAEAIQHPDCVKIYLTEIEGDFGCDTFFPLPPASFRRTSLSEPITEQVNTYRYAIYEKK